MNETALLITALVPLAWPLVSVFALIKFGPDLKDLLRRIRKGSVLGGEFELDQEVEQLSRASEGVAANTPSLPEQQAGDGNQQSLVDILVTARASPALAVLSLSIEIERTLTAHAAVRGYLPGNPQGLGSIVSLLQQRKVLSPELGRSLLLFAEIRNKIVHGQHADEAVVLSAIQSGITLLTAVRAIPRNSYVVRHAEVRIYSDPQCTIERAGVHAVILESRDENGLKADERAFPTTRTHFRKGMEVGWEWNMGLVTGNSWYKDPETGERRAGWSSSAEFTGRPIQERVASTAPATGSP